MKMLKNISIFLYSTAIILLLAYVSFLFLLPRIVNFNYITPTLEKNFYNKTGVKINLKGLNIKTSYDLTLKAYIKKTDLFNDEGKFAQINDLNFKIAFLPVLFKKVYLTNISADKFITNISYDYLQSELSKQNNNIYLQKTLPETKIRYYRITITDGRNNYTIKGQNLQLTDLYPLKKVKFNTKGELILNDKKYIDYDVNLISKLFSAKSGNSDSLKNCLDNIIKYKLKGFITADLSISGTENEPEIKGAAAFKDFVFSCEGKTFSPSRINLNFDKNKIKINSLLQINNNSKLNVNGDFTFGKSKYLNLKVLSDNIDIHELYLIAKALEKTLGLKGLNNIDMQGQLKADFNIKSDMKRIFSGGYLKIKDGKIIHKIFNKTVYDINTDIDFSNNFVQIKKAEAKIYDKPIVISGNIDKDANTNITMSLNSINISDIVPLIKNNDLKKYQIKGIANAKIFITGQLKNAAVKSELKFNNLEAKNKSEKLSITSGTVIANSLLKKPHAKISLTNINYTPDSQSSILIPSLNSVFENNEITAENTTLWLNNIKTNFSGSVSNIDKSPILKNVNISIPNYTTVPLKGYKGSKLTIKGELKINGDINKPSVNGYFSVPSLIIPTISTTVKDAYLKADDKIILTCPYVKVANSDFNVLSELNNDLSKGFVIKNFNLKSNFINLDELQNLASKQKMSDLIIQNGKAEIDSVMTKGLKIEKIKSNIAYKKDILSLNNIDAEAYTGKIAGNVSYDTSKFKTDLNIKGRNLSANIAIPAITNHKDDIFGKLDFDTILNFKGTSQQSMKSTISGDLKFQILNGSMGTLGKLEHLLYAQNIISDSFMKVSLNSATRAVTAKNTGVYKYLRGQIRLQNGVANVDYIKSSGPSMSLFMTGKFYLPEEFALLYIFGRISNDIADILGPVGNFSMEKAISSVLKIKSSSNTNNYMSQEDYKNYLEIPELTPKTSFKTKEFKVFINGNPYKQSSVNSFEWVYPQNNNEKLYLQDEKSMPKEKILPDFIERLPDYKN